jgi:lysophospholipase L1-like esterase
MIVTRIAMAVFVLAVAVAARPEAARSPRGGGSIAIGFIGDSITEGVPAGGSFPPAELTAKLLTTGGLTVRAVNEGHLGSTTADWLPRAGHSYLAEALAAFSRARVRVVHIMLGTNDANPGRAHLSPARYQANLASIGKVLNADGYIVVLSYPPFAQAASSEATRSAMDAGLRAYEPMIDGLINGKGIRRGDTHAYIYFREHPWELADGIHPTADGVQQLARLWAAALRPVVVTR